MKFWEITLLSKKLVALKIVLKHRAQEQIL